jgi:hypothetical protein
MEERRSLKIAAASDRASVVLAEPLHRWPLENNYVEILEQK